MMRNFKDFPSCFRIHESISVGWIPNFDEHRSLIHIADGEHRTSSSFCGRKLIPFVGLIRSIYAGEALPEILYEIRRVQDSQYRIEIACPSAWALKSSLRIRQTMWQAENAATWPEFESPEGPLDGLNARR